MLSTRTQQDIKEVAEEINDFVTANPKATTITLIQHFSEKLNSADNIEVGRAVIAIAFVAGLLINSTGRISINQLQEELSKHL